jgi:aminoglycoside 6'-N-acetyltransferase
VKIRFRRLKEDDLPLLHEWLQREHVRRWWDKHETYDQVAEHYLPAIRGLEPTELYLIEVDGEAAGFIQTYLASDFPQYAALVDVGEGVAGVDLFLANEAQTGRGLGSQVLDRFVNDVVFARSTTSACIADPAVGNLASIRAFEKAGFAAVRELRDPNDENPLHVLMRRDRQRENPKYVS